MNFKEVRLGDIAEFKNGVNFDKSSKGVGIKVINVSDFKDYFVPKYEELTEINPDGIVKESDYLLSDDILFVRSNGNKELVGRSMFIDKVNEPITFSGFSIRCRLSTNSIFPKYYAYLFKSSYIRNQLSNSSVGTNITNLNQGILQNLVVPIPPLPTQRRIASILSAYDDLIENNLKRIKLLEEAAQNIYKEWFVNFRFPGFEKVKIKGGMPEEWEKKKINKVFYIIKGRKPKNDLSSPSPISQLYLLVDVLERQLLRYTEDEKLPQCEPGETVMLMDGSRSGCIFRGVKGAIGSTLAVFKIMNDEINLPYAYQYFKSKENEIRSKNTGAAIPHANKSYIIDMDILIPDPKTIQGFNAVISPMNSLIENLFDANKILRDGRDILLPRLMNRTIDI